MFFYKRKTADGLRLSLGGTGMSLRNSPGPVWMPGGNVDENDIQKGDQLGMGFLLSPEQTSFGGFLILALRLTKLVCMGDLDQQKVLKLVLSQPHDQDTLLQLYRLNARQLLNRD